MKQCERTQWSWDCQNGQAVRIGDVVALTYGAYTELLARIVEGEPDEVKCKVVSGKGACIGEVVTIAPDQLLLRVPGEYRRPA